LDGRRGQWLLFWLRRRRILTMHRLDRPERYARAMVAERDAWSEVKHQLPGSPDYDEGKWKCWQAALHAVASAMDATRPPRKGVQTPHDRPGRER
jgi:hypothetical protein